MNPRIATQFTFSGLSCGTTHAYAALTRMADALGDLNRYYSEGHAAVVSPSVRRVTGRDVIPFAQFARDYAAALR